MSWFTDLFSSSPSGGMDVASGYDYAGSAVPDYDYSGAGDVASGYDYAGGAVPDYDYSPDSSLGVDMNWMSPSTSTPAFDPSRVGPPPAGGSVPEAGGFQIAPNQGQSLFGGGGGDPMTGTAPAEDTSPSTAWESKAGPWYKQGVNSPAPSTSPATTDPEAFARQGIQYPSNGPGELGGPRGGPAPTFMDKLGTWGSKVGTSLANAPGEAADQFARAPIATTAKVLGTVGPLVMGGIQASQQADQARRAEQLYRRSLPSPVPVNPLPGTGGTSRADVPAGSPMSPLMGARSGGFRVAPNVGLRLPTPQPLATGGAVGRPMALREGGPVGAPVNAPAAPSLNDSARVVMSYLARMLSRGAR